MRLAAAVVAMAMLLLGCSGADGGVVSSTSDVGRTAQRR